MWGKATMRDAELPWRVSELVYMKGCIQAIMGATGSYSDAQGGICHAP